jgi:1-acyl-sn-glycerol-3-phosphate acyltransferase
MTMAAVLGTALFMLCLLFVFVRADLGLRFIAPFSPGGIQTWLTAEQKRVARLALKFASKLTGLRVETGKFPGDSLPRSFMIVTNHQSLADIPVLIDAFPRHALRFVTKRELAIGIPMISVFLKRGGHALISRTGDYREGRKELVQLAIFSGKGICPVVFPEGSRSRSGAIRKFHAGAFRVILEHARLPVLSVAMDGGYSISRLGTLFSRLSSTVYRIKPIRLYPAPRGKQEILGLLARIEEDISSQIREWRSKDMTVNAPSRSS